MVNVLAPMNFDVDNLPAWHAHRFGLRSVSDYRGMNNHFQGGLTVDAMCALMPASETVSCGPEANASIDLSSFLTPLDSDGVDFEARELVVGVNCSPLERERTKKVLNDWWGQAEDFAVERVFAEQVAAHQETTTVAGGGGDVDSVIGVLLDEWYTSQSSVPTIHISPGMAQSSDRIKRYGNKLELETGESVAVGAGYINALGAQTGWTASGGRLFATGPVLGIYGPSEVIEAAGGSITTNNYPIYMNRTWLLAWRCAAIIAT
jgi:hypothetical protein